MSTMTAEIVRIIHSSFIIVHLLSVLAHFGGCFTSYKKQPDLQCLFTRLLCGMNTQFYVETLELLEILRLNLWQSSCSLKAQGCFFTSSSGSTEAV